MIPRIYADATVDVNMVSVIRMTGLVMHSYISTVGINTLELTAVGN